MLHDEVIPAIRNVIYDTYANLPSSGISVGDLGYATDRLVLYRWSGSAWQAVTISCRSGVAGSIGTATDYPAGSLYFATDTSVLYQQQGGSWVSIVAAAVTLEPAASDVLKNSNDTERTTNSTSYIKLKEIKVNEAFDGVMRIKFDIHDGAGFAVYGRIYKNGSPIGTEQTTQSGTYVTKSEDFTVALVADDLLQIYSKSANSGNYALIRNFRLYYSYKLASVNGNDAEDTVLFEMTAISTTNQDP